MKKLVLISPFLFLAVLLTTGCPGNGAGNGGGLDTTKVDSVKPAHDYGAAIITLERTVCFGRCPSYTLKIEGNGRVSYEGRDFVQIKGAQTSQIAAKAVKELVDEFFKIDYFALQDTFTEPITDMPSTITSLAIDGKQKQCYNYHGAPQSLIDLEKKIDDAANTDQWVKASEK